MRIITKTVKTIVVNTGEVAALDDMISEARSSGKAIRQMGDNTYMEIEVVEAGPKHALEREELYPPKEVLKSKPKM